MKHIIFWGASAHSKVLKECIESKHTCNYELIALFDNNINIQSPFNDIPLYYGIKGFEKWLLNQNPSCDIYFLVTIGNNITRKYIFYFLHSYKLLPLTAIHPTSFIADSVNMGYGSQILVNSTICVDTTIGNNCIINTNASIDHDCIIGNHVHICPNVTLTGEVQVGDCTLIGAGAVILPKVKIGSNVIVGSGAVVLKNVYDNSIVVGNPAKVI